MRLMLLSMKEQYAKGRNKGKQKILPISEVEQNNKEEKKIKFWEEIGSFQGSSLNNQGRGGKGNSGKEKIERTEHSS